MVKTKTLNQGLRIVSEHMPSVRSVAIGIWVGAGSRHEDFQENGISHFLEHMFFKGTKTRTPSDIAESFDRIGGHVNAFTSKEFTCFYAKVLDEHAPKALEILADMFFNSTFDREELEKERNVVGEEIKMVEDTPDDIIHDLLGEASYDHHPLGRPILGTTETLASFDAEALRNYMRRFYTGENVVISLAGNIQPGLIQEVEEMFRPLKQKGDDKKLEKPTFKPGQLIRSKETEQAHICLGFPGLPAGHDQMYTLILMNNLLGGSMSSRLFQQIREQLGLAYSVFSYHSSFYDDGMLTIYAGTAQEQLDELCEATLTCIRDMKNNGLTDKELENGKEQLKGSLMLSLESTSSRMSRNGKNELVLGEHRDLDEILSLIDQVSQKDILEVAEHVFTRDFSMSLINATGKVPSTLSSLQG